MGITMIHINFFYGNQQFPLVDYGTSIENENKFIKSNLKFVANTAIDGFW